MQGGLIELVLLQRCPEPYWPNAKSREEQLSRETVGTVVDFPQFDDRSLGLEAIISDVMIETISMYQQRTRLNRI